MDAKTALFGRLIDYAGLFPPAELSMQSAVSEYDVVRRGPYAWMAGRFIIPASRASELCENLEEGEAVALSAIVDAGTDSRTWLNQAADRLQRLNLLGGDGFAVSVEALETAVPAVSAARETYDAAIGQFAMLAQNAGLGELPAYIEFPRNAFWAAQLPGAMTALSRAKYGAKIRCGGAAQNLFPSSAEISAFLLAANEHAVPFKATAGLHHPIRHVDAGTGLDMHGFLNVLAAAIFVRDGATQDELIAMLDDRDATAFHLEASRFTWRDRSADVQQIANARDKAFIAYGSCSFEEPAEDLIALGMLDRTNAAA